MPVTWKDIKPENELAERIKQYVAFIVNVINTRKSSHSLEDQEYKCIHEQAYALVAVKENINKKDVSFSRSPGSHG